MFYLHVIVNYIAIPADIGRKPATLTRRREPALPVTCTRRLMKRPTAQHGGARMERDIMVAVVLILIIRSTVCVYIFFL